jgi:hypothetical protein
MHRWSFDNFAPDDCADIEIDAAVIDGMVVVRFVVLRRVGVVVDRRRAAFLDMRREQVAEGLVGCERLVGSSTNERRLAGSRNKPVKKSRIDKMDSHRVVYVVPTGSRAASVAPGAKLTA